MYDGVNLEYFSFISLTPERLGKGLRIRSRSTSAHITLQWGSAAVAFLRWALRSLRNCAVFCLFAAFLACLRRFRARYGLCSCDLRVRIQWILMVARSSIKTRGPRNPHPSERQRSSARLLSVQHRVMPVRILTGVVYVRKYDARQEAASESESDSPRSILSYKEASASKTAKSTKRSSLLRQWRLWRKHPTREIEQPRGSIGPATVHTL